jgi:uncharacterized cupredoxin-like copper-binding protein
MAFVGVVVATVALIVASVGLVVAVAARSKAENAQSEPASAPVAAKPPAAESALDVTLEEYQILTSLDSVRSGKVKFTIHNAGTMTHEVVILRSPSVDALPKVTVAGGERKVGDVDEEAVPESDKPGEATVKQGKTVEKTFSLQPGTYVLICNIDMKLPDGSILSHFQRGMYQLLTVT